MSISALPIEIELGPPLESPMGRWATLYIGGVDVFKELVYDVDQEMNRSEDQARTNLLHLFGYRLKRILEET